SIQQTTDGGFIVAGVSQSNDGDVSGNHGSSDSWVVKLNSAGEIVWQRTLGGSDEDCATSIQQTTDGGFIVAGVSQSNDGDVSGNHGYDDYWVVKLSPEGKITEDAIMPEQLAINVFPNPFNSSCAITVSYSAGVAGNSVSTEGKQRNEMTLKVYDLRGNAVWERSPDRDNRHREMSPTSRTFIWQPDKTIASGLYLVRATMGDGRTAMKKVVLVR
ncbi:hypothetical protein J7L68_04690, partial [bacterium]|nr:hypothetical protein [bacterium]